MKVIIQRGVNVVKIKAGLSICLFLIFLSLSGCQQQEVKNSEEKEIIDQVEADGQEKEKR